MLEKFDFREACYDCDIEAVARKHELAIPDVVDALNRVAFGQDQNQ